MNQWKTAVLLTDFPGQAKGVPFLEIYGETLLERTYYKAREFFDKIFIVSNSLRQKSDIERKVSDADVVLNLKNKGLFGDMLAGLKACTSNSAFVGTCNMPFLNKKVLEYLFSKTQDSQALIPKYTNGDTEILHAVYRTRPTIMALQNALFDEQKDFLQNLSLVNYLPVGELTDFDKKLETFFNLKSESELSIVKSKFNKKVYKKRLKKADTLCNDLVKEKETAGTAYYCVPGTEEEHSVTFNKRKNSWGCDCKYYTMKACYCSHILAAQKYRRQASGVRRQESDSDCLIPDTRSLIPEPIDSEVKDA